MRTLAALLAALTFLIPCAESVPDSRTTHQILRAIVLITSDKLQDDQLRHFLLEEITQCLGPLNDSPLFKDSIFFSGNFRQGNPTELCPLDRKLLLFLYNHLAPGTKPDELRGLIEEHWLTTASE